MIKTKDSAALELTWQLKEEAWLEVARLEPKLAFAERLRLAEEAASNLKLPLAIVDPRKADR